MKIWEMKEKRNEIWEGAKAFLESHRDENGILSVEDGNVYDKMELDIQNLGKEIERSERASLLDMSLAQATSQLLVNTPDPSQGQMKTGLASNEYKEAMLKAFRTGFQNVTDTLTTGVDADGGYLVPEEIDSRLVVALRGTNIMRLLGTELKTEGMHKINIASSMPVGAWIDEGGGLQFDKIDFGQMMLDAHKLHVAIKVSDELLYDNAFNLENFISVSFGEALADREEEAFIIGNGTSKPTGLFDSENGGTFGTSVATLSGDSVVDLVYSLKRQYRGKASFLLNDEMIKTIRKLKDSNGQYIWQPSNTSGEPDHLMGYKMYTSQYAPTGCIAFGDYSYYNIGDRGTRSFKRLNELFAGNGKVGFVAQERVDGKLILPEAVQILKVGT